MEQELESQKLELEKLKEQLEESESDEERMELQQRIDSGEGQLERLRGLLEGQKTGDSEE